MSIQPDDWFNRFFGFGFPFGRKSRGNYFDDMFRGFEDMRQEMDWEFDRIQKEVPKDLVREFETPEGGKVREVGPFVYGYSMTIGPDGVPRVKEFGNVKSPMNRAGRLGASMFSAEREPLSDISITDNEVLVTVELPGVPKERIKIQAYESCDWKYASRAKLLIIRIISIRTRTDIFRIILDLIFSNIRICHTL
jgi:HSP20 family protein